MENPLKEPVGTGPYKLKERKPDQYIQLVRHDGYKSRAGEPDGYGGARKQILDEIRFVPVPDPNTRIEGAVSGQYDYVDALPVEAFDRLKGQTTTQPRAAEAVRLAGVRDEHQAGRDVEPRRAAGGAHRR